MSVQHAIPFWDGAFQPCKVSSRFGTWRFSRAWCRPRGLPWRFSAASCRPRGRMGRFSAASCRPRGRMGRFSCASCRPRGRTWRCSGASSCPRGRTDMKNAVRRMDGAFRYSSKSTLPHWPLAMMSKPFWKSSKANRCVMTGVRSRPVMSICSIWYHVSHSCRP